MLEELLRLVGEGGLHSYDELAKRLDVPQPLLEAMIEDLARRGYLRDAAGACASCADCGGCATSSCASGPLWSLTEKGIRD